MTVSILIGDVFDKMAELPADHFDCVKSARPCSKVEGVEFKPMSSGLFDGARILA